MNVWAHRGASADRPENTAEAFDLARRLGADGVELDVRVCASGEVVCVHDPDLGRVGGLPLVVAESSLQRLRSLDLGGGARVTTLEEAYEAAGDLLVNVELKLETARPTGLEAAVLRAIRRVRGEDRTLFSCFHPVPLWRLRAQAPRVPRALLFGAGQSWWLRRGLHAWLAPLTGVHPEHLLVGAAALAGWRRRGLEVNVWTVDAPERIRALAALEVDGVITNAPGPARDALMGLAA